MSDANDLWLSVARAIIAAALLSSYQIQYLLYSSMNHWRVVVNKQLRLQLYLTSASYNYTTYYDIYTNKCI